MLPKYLFELFPGNWERKRPIWAMLMVNGLTPSEIASRGFPVLDLYLAQLADQHKKLVRMVTAIKVEGGGGCYFEKKYTPEVEFYD